VADAIRDIDGITDVDRSFEEGTPQEEFLLDRRKISDLGLTPRDVTEVIETAIAGSRAGNYHSEGSSYRILVQLKDAEKRSLDEVLNLTLRTADGETVALRNLVNTVSSRAPVRITRKDQKRQVRVSANVAGRDLGSVAADIKERLNSIPRPSGYELAVAGNYEEQQKAVRELTTALLLSLLLVYMVLACQYESLRDPLVVMLSTPMAAIGVLLTLLLTNTTLNLQSAIGCIMLGGIVVNNAILLVDQAGRLHAEGRSLNEAVTEAGRRRFRPILMTTLTTILGLMPLALGLGEGADAQAPLARAVVGGLAGSTVITLILIPVVYTLVHGRRRKVSS
jgi:HAE1 family hydrophobic/amphiphilic exporter-1